MVAKNPGRSSRGLRRRSRRGFSLVELGIVIAVIAVLAAVVIFGRGFISAARVTKAVDASNTARKAASTFAGTSGGAFRATAANQLNIFADRGLLPPVPAGGAWTVSGDPGSPDAIAVQGLFIGQLARGTQQSNIIRMQIQFPNNTMAVDYVSSVQNDNNFSGAGNVAGTACQAGGIAGALPAVAGNVVQACFFL